jgi:hypothetical protein
MHFYIAISSIYLGYLIYNSCNKKYNPYNDDDYFMDEMLNYFPVIHYINKVNNLSFFSEEGNFIRLCKLFDNQEIYDKMINIIENDNTIKEHYNNTKLLLTDKFFDYEHPINIPIEINGRIFNTNLHKLDVIKWFIMNDYFLFIE